MAAGDIDDALSNIPNIVLVDQSLATAAPGAGYARLEVVNGVLGVRAGSGAWVAVASLVAGLLTPLTAKATPLGTDLLLLQDEADSSSLKKVTASAIAALRTPGEALYDAYVCLADEKAQGTHGGTPAGTGAWYTRTLNTERSDAVGICTLAANQFTLGAGTYDIFARSPFLMCDNAQIRLQNVTAGTTLLTGSNAFNAAGAAYGAVDSIIQGRFTVAPDQALEIQYRVSAAQPDYGLGSYNNWTTEVYTVAELRRVA